MNLTEATMLAIQGKLKLDESKKLKKESIDVSVDDNGATIVETPEATVIVTDTQDVTEAPVEEVIVAEVPDEVETVEIPVEGDETIIPEEIVEPETSEELPTIDEIVDGETEEDLEESKKPCEKCGKEICECETIVEESKEVKTESSDATNEFVKDFAELLKKHSRAAVESMELSEDGDTVTITFKGGAQKTAHVAADSITAAIRDIMKVVESKDIKEENVEIEVSDDGKEVEVTTNEGENVEVVDETEEPETSDEVEDIKAVEVPEEEIEDDSEFIEESFERALTEYYKNNTKSIKGYKVEKITRNKNELKIEGLLTNKLDKSIKTELKANKVQEGKIYSRYEIANIKGLLESKTSTDACMIVKTTKENKLECSSIANKKLVK